MAEGAASQGLDDLVIAEYKKVSPVEKQTPAGRHLEHIKTPSEPP